jgi:hypothetical protein
VSAILPADLLRHIQRKFAKGDRAAAVTLVLCARSHEGVAGPRLQRCALVASNGSLERLMAENGELVQVRDLTKPID